MATPEEIAAVRQRLASLTPEQKQELIGLVQQRRQQAQPRPPTTREEYMGLAESLPKGSPEREQALNMAVRLAEPGAAGTAVGLTAAIPMVANPVAAAKGLVGGTIGAEGGKWVGRHAPLVGGPTLEKVLGMVGGVVGGVKGAGSAMSLRDMAEAALHPASAAKKVLGFAAGAARTAEAPVAAAEARAVAEAVGKTTRGKITPEAQELADRIIEWKTKHKLSGAQIASALRQTYGYTMKEATAIVKMLSGTTTKAAASTALQEARKQAGAQVVARAAGVTKEAIRREAGPVLGEAVGEASPILPKQALQKIIDTMKAMPMAEREAYVARATSGKAQWQIENIRRTLEHLGLLLPLGAVGAATVASQERR